MTRLEALIHALPPDLQQKAEDYLRTLSPERTHTPSSHLTLDWAGRLKDAWPGMNSVDVQHEVLKEWERTALQGPGRDPEGR